VDAGANALVIARPPRAAQMVEGKMWYGRMYGAFVKPIVMKMLVEIRNLRLDAPLIACGGVHSARDMEDFLAAGASAVQVDSAVWVLGSLDSWVA
jgi:dihydroorotate dehydrogenase (NAD+) catalytic subunit